MKNRKTQGSVFLIALAVLAVASFSKWPLTASAASSAALKTTLKGLQEQADSIAAQADELAGQIAENTSETQSTVEKKANIDKQMDLTRRQIENLNDQIQQYNLMIAAKQDELDETMAEEARLNEQYKLRIRSMEEAGDVSYWSILFGSTSFTDLLDRVDMIAEIAEADQRMVDEIRAVAEAIAAATVEIEANKATLEGVKAQLSELETRLSEQRAEADIVIAELAATHGDLEADFVLYKFMQENVRQQILDVQAQYEKALADEEAARKIAAARTQAASGAQSVPASSGGFLFPLPGGASVSQAYGYREHPIYGYYAMHYGVDLAAGRGTAIYASKSGTVTIATYSESNGNYVTINHNDGYATTYAHMTNYIVSVGQSVSQGQVIGYVGDTGWATGPHLHFEVLYGGTNVNPMEYVSG